MGKIQVVSYGSQSYVLSLIKWRSLRKILAKIFEASPHSFIPSYEIALYEGKVGEIEYSNPCFVFHYANKDIAVQRIEWMKKLIQEGGLENLIYNLNGFDYTQEAIYSDLAEHFEKRKWA